MLTYPRAPRRSRSPHLTYRVGNQCANMRRRSYFRRICQPRPRGVRNVIGSSVADGYALHPAPASAA